MAGNYWQSSHYQQWLVDKQDLVRDRNHDLSIISDEEYQKIMIFYANLKSKYGYAFQQEFPYRANHILECEFYLLENMDCCLVVYQPYRPLLQYAGDLSLDDQTLGLAWKIVNDSLRTDVSLLFPPYQIALACLQIACVIHQKDVKNWFAELNVDMERVQEVIKTILSVYELLKNFDEKKEIQGLIAKMPKPKLQPSRPPSSAQAQDPSSQQMIPDPSQQQG
ncbi:hypothetical protein QYM36_000572 [Artemia franciscana]|uniref:Cyclin-like domain-containing protein n=1 Tax=Artemia franciscana TaxID=6661 RepID=A0AA88LD97_ARTSF|nr:hypothetical protein QYM36_000572 [Artemia franciscana]